MTLTFDLTTVLFGSKLKEIEKLLSISTSTKVLFNI